MDFFERWFGLSPDGGDGATEAIVFAGIVVVVALVLWRRRMKRRDEGLSDIVRRGPNGCRV
jgi:MYXO-CTERM domain-containing protein